MGAWGAGTVGGGEDGWISALMTGCTTAGALGCAGLGSACESAVGGSSS